MSVKKMVSRSVAIALGVVCIILLAGIGGVMAYYTMQINNKDSTYNNFVSTHRHTDSDYNGLNSTFYDYMGNYTHSNSDYANLLNQVNSLEAPNVIKVNLKSDDNRPFLGTFYLHVYGEVCNVGTNTAYNCKLHVVAIQSGGVVAINTDIVLGNIGGQSWISVDASPTYSGSPLTSWIITPQWTAS
jgi:hypothetical protein